MNFNKDKNNNDDQINTTPPLIILTEEHKKALDLFKQGENMLITGSAGTGKTTLLKQIIDQCSPQSLLLCGPTGMSALQLPNGKTLHSVFNIPVGVYLSEKELKSYYHRFVDKLFLHETNESNSSKHEKKKEDFSWLIRLKNAKVIIIDEVSMVSAYMLEIIDICLGIVKNKSNKPIGGLQVIFVGDFSQLPPVYNQKEKNVPIEQKYMTFKSSVWSALNVQKVILTKIFRQENEEFANLLNTIRQGRPFQNSQHIKFNQLLSNKIRDPNKKTIFICFKRNDVSEINDQEIEKLISLSEETQYYDFPYHKTFTKNKENQIELGDLIKNVRENINLNGDKDQQIFLSNMRVMLIRNMMIEGIRLVNGDTGTIVGFDTPPAAQIKTGLLNDPWSYFINECYTNYGYKNPSFKTTLFPIVQFDRIPNKPCIVLPISWERKEMSGSSGELQSKFEVHAIPLIPAWAITSHRAQGSTISDINVHINANCMDFTEGSFYVAISRCRNFEQLSIDNFKGFRQSKEANAFYNDMFPLLPPKIYQTTVDMNIVNNENNNENSNQNNNENNEKEEKQQNKEQQNTISNPVNVWIQEQLGTKSTPTDFQTDWFNLMEPILNSFWDRYRYIKTVGKKNPLAIEKFESWIKQKKIKK